MSFFLEDYTPPKSNKSKSVSVDILHRSECSACPLNTLNYLKHPRMAPTGSDSPVVYMLGEAPGAEEDKTGKQFVGKSGRFLRKRIPRGWLKKLRWNNCVRTRPPQNKTPSYVEIECCRPSIVRDIEETKPKAIFGFGNIPLNWATGLSRITVWSGRRMPIRVGSHTCWFYPFLHPSGVLRDSERSKFKNDGYASETEFAFELQLQRAFDEVEGLHDAVVMPAEQALSDLTIIDSSEGKSDTRKIAKILSRMASAKLVGLDYETNSTRPYKRDSKVLTAAVCDGKQTVAFPFDHRQAKWSRAERRFVISAWEDFIFNSDCLKVAHNLAFELEWSMMIFGYDALYNGAWGCSMAQAHTLDERYGSGALSLDGLCVNILACQSKR